MGPSSVSTDRVRDEPGGLHSLLNVFSSSQKATDPSPAQHFSPDAFNEGSAGPFR